MSRKDYFNNDGALTTELQVLEHDRSFKATLWLTETASGLTASIVSVQNDPDGLLEPLLIPTYTFDTRGRGLVFLFAGSWGSGCEPIEASGRCHILDFSSTLTATSFVYEGCHEGLVCEELIESADFFMGFRNVKSIGENKYQLDIVTFGPGSDDNPPGRPGTLLLSEGSLELVGQGKFSPLVNRPVVSE